MTRSQSPASETAPAQPAERRRKDNTLLGIGLTLLALLIFGLQDAMSKTLVQTYSPFQVAMIRYWAFALFALWLAARQAPLRHAFRSAMPKLQVLRGVLLVLDVWCFSAALISVPLGELQAIMLIYPLLVTLAAIPILGEKVGVFRFVAVGVGFAGALIIVRPGGLPLSVGVLFAVGAALAYALYLTLTRKVSARDSTATSMVYVGVIGLVMTTAVGVFHWQGMGPTDMLLMGGVILTSISGHGLMMVALSRAPASVMQPFHYSGLPWAIILSYVVFGHMIDGLSLVGAGVIVGAGLVVMARERYRARLSAAASAATSRSAEPPSQRP